MYKNIVKKRDVPTTLEGIFI